MKNRQMATMMFAFCLLSIPLLIFISGINAKTTGGWTELPQILAKINSPVFPAWDFKITDFGVVGDGVVDCTPAFKAAISACNKAGGGRVVVPAGKFFTGAIHLKSNVNLHLLPESIIKFSTDPHKYLPVVLSRWESTEVMNYSALIYAYEQENIAITGTGVIDGQAGPGNWWSWVKSAKVDSLRLVGMGNEDIPVKERIFGEGHFLRPNLVQTFRCRNVLIQGVTFKNSPMWNINPVYCKNVIVQGVTVEGTGPNTDGCNPDSCSYVLIKNCTFNTGDDCIAIKSGRDRDGHRVNLPSEYIVIQDCQMKNGHGGLTCGSETAGNIRNIYAENCTMSSPNLDMALRFKTNADRGGTIENVYIRNCKVQQAGNAGIHITMKYAGVTSGAYTPAVRNIEIKDCQFTNISQAIFMEGLSASIKVTNIRIDNCRFKNIRGANTMVNVDNVRLKNVFINGKLQP